MEKHQFKPFDKVLKRDSDKDYWEVDFYSRHTPGGHRCLNFIYSQCIPYNEETKHLLGTSLPYKKSIKEPEPKVWQISSTEFNEVMTSEELENFIKGAVIRNKDITNFQIRYIDNN